jgi:hypothetical protein
VLVEYGHSWSSIKNYTLSEIGVFYKTIILREREGKVDSLIRNWISANSSYEGLQDTIKNLEFKGATANVKEPQSEPQQDETRSEWIRLRKFMSGRK